MNPGFEIKEKFASLQEALLSAHPRMPVLLKEIHDFLDKEKHVVTLLSEEEIAIVVLGLKRQTATEITVSTASKKGGVKRADGKKDVQLTLDDIG